jgi:hypothetical protein
VLADTLTHSLLLAGFLYMESVQWVSDGLDIV